MKIWPWTQFNRLQYTLDACIRSRDEYKQRFEQAVKNHTELSSGHNELVYVAKGRKKKLRELGVDVAELDRQSRLDAQTYDENAGWGMRKTSAAHPEPLGVEHDNT